MRTLFEVDVDQEIDFDPLAAWKTSPLSRSTTSTSKPVRFTAPRPNTAGAPFARSGPAWAARPGCPWGRPRLRPASPRCQA